MPRETNDLSTALTARLIGVHPTVLLQWERRYGWPKPERLPNGHRRYSPEVVDALSRVAAWRDAGVPLSQALRQARQLASSTSRAPSPLTTDHLTELFDRLGMIIVVTKAPNFEIELANLAQRGIYPGRELVGRRAPEALTHSHGLIDTLSVLRHVASTGETVRFVEQRVPIGGEDHWWTLNYFRLNPEPFADVRVVISAIDVTEYVSARNRTQAIVDQFHPR